MISRRFLLGAAPCALVAATVPVQALSIGELLDPGPELVGSTWGAGLDAIDVDYWRAVSSGWLTVSDVRRMEEMPELPNFGFEALLRGKP